MKKSCGIYEIVNDKGRLSYKIFSDAEDLQRFLNKNKSKTCRTITPLVEVEYREFPNTQVRKLTTQEIETYMSERNADN